MTLHPTHHHKIVSVLLCVVIVIQLYRQTVDGKNIPYSMIVGLQAKQWKQFKRKLLIINFAHCRIVNLYLSTIVRCICCMLFLRRPRDFFAGLWLAATHTCRSCEYQQDFLSHFLLDLLSFLPPRNGSCCCIITKIITIGTPILPTRSILY